MGVTCLQRLVMAGLFLLLGACTWAMPTLEMPTLRTAPPDVTARISQNFTPENLTYCFAHSCARRHAVVFAPAQWDQVRAVFTEPASDDAANSPDLGLAAQERQYIRAAIGLMERIAAAQAGTEGDLAGTTPIFFQANGPAQLDCYDEAINTSNFLGLLARDGLLRHHRVRPPVQRWFVGGDYIHATAVIEESNSALYAVDSSFHHSGAEAETAPLEAWLAGWAPMDDARSLASTKPQ